MTLFYNGLILFVVAAVVAIANILTAPVKHFMLTVGIHVAAAVCALGGIICIVIWLAQTLHAIAT